MGIPLDVEERKVEHLSRFGEHEMGDESGRADRNHPVGEELGILVEGRVVAAVGNTEIDAFGVGVSPASEAEPVNSAR